MMVLCNANAIMRYDRRRSWLSSALLDIEHDNSKFDERRPALPSAPLHMECDYNSIEK